MASVTDITDEEVEAMFEHHQIPNAQRILLRKEIALSRALRAKCLAIKDQLASGETMEWDTLGKALSGMAESMGYDMGIPMPDLETGHQFITARNTPLGHQLQYMTGRTEHAGELAGLGLKVMNSWEVIGDRSIAILEDADGNVGMITDHHAGRRLRKNVGGQLMRAMLPNLTAEAELKAMDCLKQKLTHNQWTSYVLNGSFPEESKKSGLHYIFRKGLPTLVLSYHGTSGGRVIAALCMHPFGYYAGTHVGSMVPSDEVIAHLLMMRADEHKYWGKSGQWEASDPRSGI